MESPEERLVDACYNGDLSLVESLIEEGASVDCVNSNGGNPLTMACSREHTNVAKFLLQNGAQVNLPNSQGESALIIACNRGDLQLATMLLDYHAEVNVQSKSRNSALMMACCGDNVNNEVAEVLLNHGADLNQQDRDGDSALTIASWWGHVELARKLIDHGAQVNLLDSDGKSALTMASLKGNVAIARLLLENGVDANLRSTNGKTALSYASSEEMVDLLMLASTIQLIKLLLPIAHKWRVLGKRLGLSKATLDSFQTIQEEESCLQAVMTAWSKQTHPPPTWRGLIRAVKSVDRKIGQKMNELSTLQVNVTSESEEEMSDSSPSEGENDRVPMASEDESGGRVEGEHDDDTDEGAPDDKHLAAVQQAIKSKGILEHALAHGVLVGSAGSGKSSLMSRLLGEMPSSATSPSTGVANRVVQVEVRKSSSIAVSVLNTFSDSVWRKIQHDEEAAGFVTQIMSYLSNQEVLPSTLSDKTHPLPATPTNTKIEMSSSQTTQLFNIQSVSDGNTTLPYPAGYVAPMGVFKNALCQGRLEKLRQHFENSWSLYLTDTGGQMEFQEVLPLLVSGPSIFFITFRLDQDLKQRFTIQYRLPDGGRSEPYESSLTVDETILQTLASVASMGTFTYKGPQMKSIPLKPKVLIVGTHKDMLDQSTVDSKIKEIDEHLQKLIGSTSEDLVEFSSESQLIFTVNNLSENDNEFIEIRAGVERVVQRGDFKMSYPSHWLIFSLVLRQQMIEDRIISFEQCFAIAQDCGITDRKELNHALWFLHTKIGLIRHFSTPGLKDVVIRDPQVLFDQVTQLIVKTFTFKKLGKRRFTDFKKQGVFSFEDFKNGIQTSPHFLPPEKLLLLLEELRIVASFQTDEGDIKYFLPCVLAHSEVPSSPVPTSDIPHLLITFKCGYCPKGLAGALIVYLLNNEMGSKFKWELKTDQIFRDQVSFLVSPYDFITLKIHPTFLECIHYPVSIKSAPEQKSIVRTKSYSLECVCNEVRLYIQEGIQKISSNLNFTSDAKHTISFFCGDADCVQGNGPHPAISFKHEDNGLFLRCKKSGDTVVSPPPTDFKFWFEGEYKVECDHQDTGRRRSDSTNSPTCSSVPMDIDVSTSRHSKRPQLDTVESPISDISSSAAKRLRITHDVSPAAVCLDGNSIDVVPPDDSIKCSRQPGSRGSPTRSDELRFFAPTIQNLTLLKWKDKRGHKQTLRLIKSVSPKWYELGDVIGVPDEELQALSVKHRDDIKHCCRDVFNYWLKNQPSEDYPVTWEGLCELLDDLDFSQLAKTLKEALHLIQKESA